MKNFKHLLVATFVLLSTSSMARIVNPLVPLSEDAPSRFSFGLKGGFGGGMDDKKFGLSSIGGGISFAQYLGYDVEWGLGLGYDYTSWRGRIFTEASKASQGSRVDAELMFRYMPEVAERFHLGLTLSLGWGRQFGTGAEEYNKARKFGDLNFEVGPATSYAFNDITTMYFAVLYRMNNIAFGVEDDKFKKMTNVSGFDFPLGFLFHTSEYSSFFIEANSRLTMLSKGHVGRGFKEEITIGYNHAF